MTRFLLALAALALPFLAAPASAKPRAIAHVKLLDGKPAGTVSFAAVNRGVLVEFDLSGLPPGPHGIHLHVSGNCDPKTGFTSAGPIDPSLSLYYIGPEQDTGLLNGLGIARTGIEKADVALCVGLADDLTETPDDYSDILAAMRARNLTMLCANPDLKVYRGSQLCWCAGALAKAYEAIGGPVVYYGKPYPAVYDAALKAAGRPSRALAIGDALITDLKGAKAAGLAALFIADGLHGEEIEPYTPEHLGEMFAAAHVEAKAAMRALKW